MMGVPEHLREEQLAVEAEIRAAFRGGKRHAGVSWSESMVVDNYGSDDERAAARARDIDKRWEDLVDDPNWDHEAGVGGFNFLDAVGYTYYIAPAMIRCCREGCSGGSTCFALTMNADFKLGRIRALDDRHVRAICRLLRFMIAVSRAIEDSEEWETAYDSYWRDWEGGSLSD